MVRFEGSTDVPTGAGAGGGGGRGVPPILVGSESLPQGVSVRWMSLVFWYSLLSLIVFGLGYEVTANSRGALIVVETIYQMIDAVLAGVVDDFFFPALHDVHEEEEQGR